MAADGSGVVDFLVKDEKDTRNLSDACRRDDTAAVRELLDQGAYLGAQTWWGGTPLFVACDNGALNCVELLLDRGADPTITIRGNNLLHVLCFMENTSDIVLQLLARSISFDAYNDDGDTPLIIACRANNVRCASVLIHNGASIEQRCLTTGYTPLETAQHYGSSDCVELLMSWNWGAEVGPSHYHDNVEEVELAGNVSGSLGSTPDFDPSDGVTDDSSKSQQSKDSEQFPLFIACQTGQVERVHDFLKAGADPNTKKFLISSLHTACFMKHVECVRLLLKHKADVEIRDPTGNTPLFDACEYSDEPTCARLLLENNANANALNRFGETPLTQGCKQGCLKYVRLLIEHGANPHIPNHHGNTPLDIARANGYDEIVRFIEMTSEPFL